MQKTISGNLGVIGDLHAEAENLAAILSFFKQESLQTILCTGDLVNGNQPNVEKCCELLQELRVLTVRGNHDRWCLEKQTAGMDHDLPFEQLSLKSQQYLGALPVSQEFETGAGKLLLCHGLGSKDMWRLTPDDYGYALEMNFELQDLVSADIYRFVINGHTHQRMVRTFGNLTVINAGSITTNQKQKTLPCFSIVNFEEGEVQFYSLGNEMRIIPQEKVLFQSVLAENLPPPTILNF